MRRLLPVATLLTLFSCELITEVKIRPIPSRLVVNCVYTSDNTFRIQVSRTHHILGEGPPPPELKNVVATIANDTDQTAMFVEFGKDDENSFLQNHALKSQPGHTYTLSVHVPGFEPAFATSRAPQVVEIIDVRIDSANMIPPSENSQGGTPIEFTFRDPPGEGDFYFPQFFLMYTYDSRDSSGNVIGTFESPMEYRLSKIIPSGILEGIGDNEGEVLNDKGLDGTLRTIRLYITQYRYYVSGKPPLPKWKFTLGHTYEDYYKYFHSVTLQQYNDGNPFAQPVQIHTNIQGGLGIFAGVATSTWDHK
jgi:hypothetical protein